jgi:hypothetical protein
VASRPQEIERRRPVTKNPRDPRTWTNIEIAKDTQGYLGAQQAWREDREAAALRRTEEDDKARFTERFIRAGGKRQDAEAAFSRQRGEDAARRAKREEDEALAASRRSIRRGL